MNAIGWIIAVGIGATFVMDLWAVVQRRVLRVATLDYALVGRWLGHMKHGQIAHASITAAPPIQGERAIGRLVHYATGIGFAALLWAAGGAGWARDPTPLLAATLGVLTVAVPFAVMQPALGLGFAAGRTAHPWHARARSLLTHLVFGLGLYLVALLLAGQQ